MPVLEPVYVILSLGIMTITLAMAAFMLLTMFRAWRAPRIYYPPRPSARELVKELMCPRCGLKELEPTGFYTIQCRSCGFMFSVGVAQAYPYYPGWWFWPIFEWWSFLWIWPFIWLKKNILAGC